MLLASGPRFGPYEIVALLGAGGMGEVYRARDPKLNREIALKLLPELFARDGERLARFTREAQVLASLNHPNIATIHGLEEANGATALILELVEGPTLADRTGEGPIPIPEALAIARQIADALEAAHTAGIIHRDLKPANIKLRPDGTVKVLDFGLAKVAESVVGAGLQTGPKAITNSPTLTSPAMMLTDGRWIAYSSNESGKNEVYVAPFPGPGGKWQVSTAGANYHRWRRDGKEIFYLALDNRLMAATVNGQGAGFEVRDVRPLFTIRGSRGRFPFDVSPDGQRFLVNMNTFADQATAPAPMTVVVNWMASLRK